MVRRKEIAIIAGRCLIALCLVSSQSWANSFKIGEITQAQGEITYLAFHGQSKAKTVKAKQKVMTDGSYLTRDAAFFTVKLFEGSWLRISPSSKFSVAFEPKEKIITINLFTGSLKALFSTTLNGNKATKLVIKSGDGVFETVEAKFSAVRNPLMDESSVYVEKGTVIAVQNKLNEKKDVKIIHAREMASLKDHEELISAPRTMTDKELRFIHSSFYLKGNKQEI